MAIDQKKQAHNITTNSYYIHHATLRRVLRGATKVEQGKIRVCGKQLLVITGFLITTTVTQRATSCHYRWFMFLFHWIIQSSTHLIYPRFVNSYPGLHITLLVITSAWIAITLTQRAMSFHHQWDLCFLHGMIHSLIQLSCPWFFNSHPALHITQHMSCKLLQYPAGLILIRQIPCHHRPLIMDVEIFMDAWLMCLLTSALSRVV